MMEVVRRQVGEGSRQVLARLSSPGDEASEYVLHPRLVDAALEACVGLVPGAIEWRLPAELEALRIVSPSTRIELAWVRAAAGGREAGAPVKLDIDLCDESGHVCAQVRGIGWREGRLTGVEPAAEPVARAARPETGSGLAAVRREIGLGASARPAGAAVEQRKVQGAESSLAIARKSGLPIAGNAVMPG